MRDYQTDSDDTGSLSAPATAPGKRTLTDHIAAGPRGGGAPKTQGVAVGGAAADSHEDPFALHVEMKPSEREEVFAALHEVVEKLEDLAKKLAQGGTLTGWLGKPLADVSKAMKRAGKALHTIAEKFGIVVLVADLIDATDAWSKAFDAYQQGRSPDRAAALTHATDRWCTLAIDAAKKLPQPAAAVIINALKGANVAVAVGVNAGTQSLSSVRADEAHHTDGPPPAPAPAAPTGSAYHGASSAYRRAFHAAVEAAPNRFPNENARQALLLQVDGLIDEWAAAEQELADLEAFWKVGPLSADQAKIDAARKRVADAKWKINHAVGGYNGDGSNMMPYAG